MSMSSNEGTGDVLAPARQAEQDLNSYRAKTGTAAGSFSANESGVDSSAEKKFPGASITYGSAASGTGDNRDIPESEGGGILPGGRPTKARDFEGPRGPEGERETERRQRSGDDDIE